MKYCLVRCCLKAAFESTSVVLIFYYIILRIEYILYIYHSQVV